MYGELALNNGSNHEV